MIKHAFATKVVAAALMLLLLAIASLFAFAQPAAVKGMSVQQQPTPIPNDSDHLWPQFTPDAWQEAARKVTYRVFMPQYVPAEFVSGWPSYDAQTGAIVQNYLSVGNPSVLVIIQMPSSKVQGGPPGKQVKVGNIMGRYWEKENRCFLFLDRDGTHIELQASPSVGSENLIRIAGSMQQVP